MIELEVLRIILFFVTAYHVVKWFDHLIEQQEAHEQEARKAQQRRSEYEQK